MECGRRQLRGGARVVQAALFEVDPLWPKPLAQPLKWDNKMVRRSLVVLAGALALLPATAPALLASRAAGARLAVEPVSGLRLRSY